MKLVLLHSPLVGPGTWRTLAPLLRAQGYEVAVPDYSGEMAGGPPYYARIVRTARAATGSNSASTILVAHSGAGALVPAIADGGLAGGAIFIDALLPHPRVSWFSTAPEALKSRLVQMERDGRLPPWHRWWQKGAIESLFNDATAYQRFAAELNDLPFAYFNEPAPAIDLSGTIACAYLQLGSGYEAEAAIAEERGWPVARLKLHHLAILTHGEEIVAQVEVLARRLIAHPAD